MKKHLSVEEMSKISQLYHTNSTMTEEELDLYYDIVRFWESESQNPYNESTEESLYPSMEILENKVLLDPIQ